jgi:hypothetical protein
MDSMTEYKKKNKRHKKISISMLCVHSPAGTTENSPAIHCRVNELPGQ